MKSFFEELVPEYDDERVYGSDIKKVFQWYNQLHSHDLLEVVDKEEEGEDATDGETATEEPASEGVSDDAPSEEKSDAK